MRTADDSIPIEASAESIPIEGSAEIIPIEAAESIPIEGAESIPIEASAESIPIEGSAESIPIKAAESIPIEASAESIPIEGSAESIPIEGSAESIPIEATESFPIEADKSPEYAEYAERIKTYREMCARYATYKFQGNNPMVYVPKHNFSYCMNPKTGSTTFSKQLLTFLPIENWIKKKTRNIHHHLMCKSSVPARYITRGLYIRRYIAAKYRRF